MTINFPFLNSRHSVHSAGMVICLGGVTNALIITRLLLMVPLVAVACSFAASKQKLLSIDGVRLRKNEMYLAR